MCEGFQKRWGQGDRRGRRRPPLASNPLAHPNLLKQHTLLNFVSKRIGGAIDAPAGEIDIFRTTMKPLPRTARRRYSQALYWLSVGSHGLIPGTLGSYYVVGHGKSGTNWLCNLLSHYFGIPVFEGWTRLTPALSSQIFHLHRFVVTPMARRRTFYLYRDGRDVVVSSYFAKMRQPDPRFRREFEAYSGDVMEESNVRGQLPAYIDWFFGVDRVSSIRWQPHIEESFKHPYVRLSFERMIEDTYGELERALREMTGSSIDSKKLVEAIAQNDFAKKKKKANAHFLRSGRTGDWRQYFTRAAADRFNHHAGEALIALGYEESLDWVKECPES